MVLCLESKAVWQYAQVGAASDQVRYLIHHSFLIRNSSQTGVQGFRWPYVKTHLLPYVTPCDWWCKDCAKS